MVENPRSLLGSPRVSTRMQCTAPSAAVCAVPYLFFLSFGWSHISVRLHCHSDQWGILPPAVPAPTTATPGQRGIKPPAATVGTNHSNRCTPYATGGWLAFTTANRRSRTSALQPLATVSVHHYRDQAHCLSGAIRGGQRHSDHQRPPPQPACSTQRPSRCLQCIACSSLFRMETPLRPNLRPLCANFDRPRNPQQQTLTSASTTTTTVFTRRSPALATATSVHHNHRILAARRPPATTTATNNTVHRRDQCASSVPHPSLGRPAAHSAPTTTTTGFSPPPANGQRPLRPPPRPTTPSTTATTASTTTTATATTAYLPPIRELTFMSWKEQRRPASTATTAIVTTASPTSPLPPRHHTRRPAASATSCVPTFATIVRKL